ncbi:MAG: bifunctional demethylmenaquinone methyltransferase/2-methoxy-6-polyprenyl-1,4-benzoquinol methylase UbiE [Bernardetiaceae bacterium]
MSVVPYKNKSASKKEQVAEMFDNISHRYDFLNHFLSLGIDILWRKQAIRLLKADNPQKILDIATGTADFALEAAKGLSPKAITGVDISEGMLAVGRQKIAKKGLQSLIQLHTGDSENLQFEDNYFDALIVAFGVRNFENLELGLSEMRRVLRPGGKVVIIEFSKPRHFPFQQIYNAYFQHLLPRIGKTLSKDDSAYRYLPESVQAFPDGENFIRVLEKIGYQQAQCKPLTFGIASIYVGTK